MFHDAFLMMKMNSGVNEGMQGFMTRDALVLVPGAVDERDGPAGVSQSTGTQTTPQPPSEPQHPRLQQQPNREQHEHQQQEEEEQKQQIAPQQQQSQKQQQEQEQPQQQSQQQQQQQENGTEFGAKPLRKRPRRTFHRSSAAEVFLEQQQQQQQQQGACDDADMANDDADGGAYGGAGGSGFGLGPRLARESWFQPKWVPGPLFAVRDVLSAFPATQPATEQENPALVRAEADPRFDLEDLRALSYDEYVETVISSVLVCFVLPFLTLTLHIRILIYNSTHTTQAGGETREQIRDKYIGANMTEERRRELGLIAESELSHTVAVQASRPVGSSARFLAFKMAALESELAIVREGGREYLEQSETSNGTSNSTSTTTTTAATAAAAAAAAATGGEETERPGRRRAKGRETKQARSYQRITSILKDESYFGPTEPASTVEMMSAARAKLVYQDPSPDVVADARLAALFDRQHVPDLVGEKENEIVLRVTFYSKRFAKDQEYLVLGSQPLVVLRDAISCAVDGMMIASERQQRSPAVVAQEKDSVPPSENPTEENEQQQEQQEKHEQQQQQQQSEETSKVGTGGGHAAFFKSASFLIENVFYNDTRDAANADYSAPILEWAEERRKDLRIKCAEEDALLSAQHSVLGPYRVEDMARVRFDQLLVRIGSVYAFLHQADCEHRFMISDVRLLGPGEDHDRSNYPLLLTRSRITRSRCDICAALVASKVTCNDAQAPCSPCHWCQHCYDAFHYNADGTPTYTDFQVLPYVYDTK